jgi:hypothetical protein
MNYRANSVHLKRDHDNSSGSILSKNSSLVNISGLHCLLITDISKYAFRRVDTLEEPYCFFIVDYCLVFVINDSLKEYSISTYDSYAIRFYNLNFFDQFLDARVAVSDLSSLFLQELRIKILIL